MQEVSAQSDGQYKLGPGTLYDNLQRMMGQGLVEEIDRPEEPRRRYYRLSSLGKAVLSAEMARLEGVIREGRLRLSGTKARRA
jgi:DNA-binding PadR family transcriptional regulator